MPRSVMEDVPGLAAAALRILDSRADGVTPRALAGLLAGVFGRSRRWAMSAIAALVVAGELAYREQHGHTIIEPSYDRAVRFSPRVVVKPPGAACLPRPGDAVVQLAHGASFGTGQHPTTRLSVRGIDMALSGQAPADAAADSAVLDVGTGSGILAITALMLGIGRGTGLDIDPCAVAEARHNALLNGLAARLSICRTPIGEIQGRFTLITANLRFPTLRAIFPEMLRLSAPRAAWVVSGIRTEEVRPLTAQYGASGLTCVWQAAEKDWAALVFVRNTASG